MKNEGRHIAKNVKGFLFLGEMAGKPVHIEYKGFGVFDTKNDCFVCINKKNSGRPYTPCGGRSTALEVAGMINRGELLIKPHKVRHAQKK